MKRALLVGAALLFLGAFAAQPRAQTAPSAGDDAGGGNGVTTRVERLEEQIVDLQGIVAAVETLAKSGGGGAPTAYSGGGGAGLSADQFRQLSEQIADLTQRIERLEARFGMSSPVADRRDFAAATPLSPAAAQPGASSPSGAESYSATALPPASSGAGGFGTAIVPQDTQGHTAATPSADDSPGSVFGSPGTTATPRASDGPITTAAVTSGPARALYDQAFGALKRREYRAAETYFQEFLTKFPSDALAGEAQFYLGETAYQSAEYRSAADRFLKAYSEYPASEKAPEALLKLAMSLRRLGEKSAACDSFAEFERRFPNVAGPVKQSAQMEKRRADCT